MTPAGTWFVIREGEDTLSRGDGWMSFAICPRCSAMVLADKKHSYGDQTWAHERWHADTDWPIPADVQRQILEFAVTGKVARR